MKTTTRTFAINQAKPHDVFDSDSDFFRSFATADAALTYLAKKGYHVMAFRRVPALGERQTFLARSVRAYDRGHYLQLNSPLVTRATGKRGGQ